MDNPFVLMIAGPNGAGKTTLFRSLVQNGVEFGEYINPDDIARELEGPYDQRVRQAQRIADEKRDFCIAAKRSFSFETVMSHPSKIDILRRAKAAGFIVELFFVGIDDPETNIERVELRVAQGGHDVPREKIVARWHRTMGLLLEALGTSDRSFLFDNSAAAIDVGPVLAYTALHQPDGSYELRLRINPPPSWLRQYVLKPIGFPLQPPAGENSQVE